MSDTAKETSPKPRVIAYAKHHENGWIVYGMRHGVRHGLAIPKGIPLVVVNDIKAPEGNLSWLEIELIAHIQHEGALPNPVVNQLAMNFGKPYPVVHGLREASESEKFLEENLSKNLLAWDGYGFFFNEKLTLNEA